MDTIAAPEKYVRGSVKSIKAHADGTKGSYCFITGNRDGVDHFAHMSEFTQADWDQLKVHQAVRFQPAMSDMGARALRVRVVHSGTDKPMHEASGPAAPPAPARRRRRASTVADDEA